MFLGTDVAALRGSTIQQSTIEAYLATDYRVPGPPALVLRVGQINDGLAALHSRFACAHSALLTAWNPFSEIKPESENQAAQADLEGEIAALGAICWPACGADPLGKWPPEDSVLALGLELKAAARLGRKFNQNGFVWAGADARPQLVLLR